VSSFIKAVTWDCSDALRLGAFWAAALGTDRDEDSTEERAYVEAAGWGGPNMWFVRVPEEKTAKNRLHVDLRPHTTMNEEVERLLGLGASEIRRFDTHVMMLDPEGNEFCVEPGANDTDA
jgi:hypothetical protein